MSDDDRKQVHAIIFGHVQGVGFRATACRIAHHMGIKGSVRNLNDGSVEIYAQGSQSLLEKFFVLLAKQTSGRVDTIQKRPISIIKPFIDFRIL